MSPSVLPVLSPKGSKKPRGAVCPASPSALPEPTKPPFGFSPFAIDSLVLVRRTAGARLNAADEAANEAMIAVLNMLQIIYSLRSCKDLQ